MSIAACEEILLNRDKSTIFFCLIFQIRQVSRAHEKN